MIVALMDGLAPIVLIANLWLDVNMGIVLINLMLAFVIQDGQVTCVMSQHASKLKVKDLHLTKTRGYPTPAFFFTFGQVN